MPLYILILSSGAACSKLTTWPSYNVAMELYNDASMVSSVRLAVCNAANDFGFSGTVLPERRAALQESVHVAISRISIASSLSPFGLSGFGLHAATESLAFSSATEEEHAAANPIRTARKKNARMN